MMSGGFMRMGTCTDYQLRCGGQMNFSDLVLARQSVRRYADLPVSAEHIDAIVEVIRLAPSASNSQPWTVIVVDEPGLRRRIAEATFSRTVSFNRFALDAPVLLVLTMERPRLLTQVAGWLKKREFPLIDIGIAAEHACLQATDLGLGSCIIGWFDEKRIKSALGVPRSNRIPLVLTIGHPAEDDALRPKRRKAVAAMCGRNRYPGTTEQR
jgi:nitroreductase